MTIQPIRERDYPYLSGPDQVVGPKVNPSEPQGKVGKNTGLRLNKRIALLFVLFEPYGFVALYNHWSSVLAPLPK